MARFRIELTSFPDLVSRIEPIQSATAEGLVREIGTLASNAIQRSPVRTGNFQGSWRAQVIPNQDGPQVDLLNDATDQSGRMYARHVHPAGSDQTILEDTLDDIQASTPSIAITLQNAAFSALTGG